jgi:hypothetical protein
MSYYTIFPLVEAARLEADYQLWLEANPNTPRTDKVDYLNSRRLQFDQAYMDWRSLPKNEMKALPEWIAKEHPENRREVLAIRMRRKDELAEELRQQKGIERLHPHDLMRLSDQVGLKLR